MQKTLTKSETNKSTFKFKTSKEEEDKIAPKKKAPIFQSGAELRAWLRKHGKKEFIDFDDDARSKLRKYFNSLDQDGSRSIGVDELEDPLIALGLVANREDVEKLIASVDEDQSGQIEFDEFLAIMKNLNSKDGKESVLFKFFQSMYTGKLMDNMDPNLPFKLNVSQYRRRKLLDAIMLPEREKDKKEQGIKILQSFKKQVVNNKQRDKIAKGENPNDISIDQVPNHENGVNTRTGFPKYSRIMPQNSNLLIKPISVPIQSLKK